MTNMIMRAATALGRWAGLGAAVALGIFPLGAATLANPFFAMDTGTRDAAHATIAAQVKLIKDLGFAGFGPTWSNPQAVRATLAALDQHGLKMQALYLGINIDAGKRAVTPQLKEAIQALRGRETMLWLYVQSSKFKPSAPEGDEAAVEALQELAGLAQDAKLKVALYPHTSFWIERVEDAVRVARKVARPNLGVTFNLCHWLKVDGKDLQASLDRAAPHLLVVTVNGADQGGRDWAQLIQPLDRGTYDIRPLLAALVKMGYQGPIGLQHYGIGGSAEENLRRSMEAWKKLSAQVAAPAGNPAP